MIKNILNLTFTSLVFLSIIVLQSSQAVGQEIIQISEDLYTGELITENEGSLYFGMERIDESNYDIWNDYSKNARWICNPLKYMAFISDKEIPADVLSELLSCTGYSEDDFQKLLNYMKPNKKKLSMLFDNNGILAGINGFKFKKDGTTFVAYVSKTPVTRKFRPKHKLIEENFTLKQYQETYDNIIMCVRINDLLDKPVTDHRGIFRNPTNYLSPNENCKNVSMKLHGFGGKIALQFFKEKRFMTVSPVETMANILGKSVHPNDMFIHTDKNTLELQQHGSPAISYEDKIMHQIVISSVSGIEKPHFIKLDALSNFFN